MFLLWTGSRIGGAGDKGKLFGVPGVYRARYGFSLAGALFSLHLDPGRGRGLSEVRIAKCRMFLISQAMRGLDGVEDLIQAPVPKAKNGQAPSRYSWPGTAAAVNNDIVDAMPHRLLQFEEGLAVRRCIDAATEKGPNEHPVCVREVEDRDGLNEESAGDQHSLQRGIFVEVHGQQSDIKGGSVRAEGFAVGSKRKSHRSVGCLAFRVRAREYATVDLVRINGRLRRSDKGSLR